MSQGNIVVAQKPRSVDEIPVVSAAEFLLESVRKHVPKSKDRVWVGDVVKGTSVKFGEVEPLSRKIASALMRRGFGKSEILYFSTYDMATFFLVQFSCWRCNGATRGCYQTERIEEFVRQMRESETRFVLCDPMTAPALKEAIGQLDWDVQLFSIGEVDGATTIEKLLEDDGSAFPDVIDVNPKEDVILITNTSGSTGRPKATMLTHFNIVATLAIRNDITMVDLLSVANNFAVAANVGTTIALHRAISTYSVLQSNKDAYFEAVDKIKPFCLAMYPYFAAWFVRTLDFQKTDLSFVKAVAFGGSVLDAATVKLVQSKLPRVIIIQNYGMSESFAISDSSLFDNRNPIKSLPKIPEVGDSVSGDSQEVHEYLHSGKLTPFVQAKIADVATGEALGRNRRGEIHVKAPATMKGYLKEPELTSKVIDSEGWLHTGDIGFFDDEDHLYILDRKTSVFKYFMHFISPAELEGILQEHPAVYVAGVVGIPHPESTNQARAYVVKRPGHNVTEEELKNFVAERTADYKHLRGGVIFVDTLTDNQGGKLDRVKLRKMALGQL